MSGFRPAGFRGKSCQEHCHSAQCGNPASHRTQAMSASHWQLQRASLAMARDPGSSGGYEQGLSNTSGFFSLAVLLRPCVCSVLCSSECLLRAWPGLHLLYSSTASTLERANNKGRQGRYSCQGPWASVAALLKMTGSTCPARRWLWRPPLLGESIGEPDERDAWIQLVTFYLR